MRHKDQSGDTSGASAGSPRRTALATGWAALRATLTNRAPAPTPQPAGPVVWVLSGGGAMGAAQAGMAMELMSAGVQPDVLVGCSAGALNAAGIALDPTLPGVHTLAGIWREMAREHPLHVRPLHALGQILRGRDHVIDPTPMRETLHRVIGDRDLRDLSLPVHVVTTRLADGQTSWHTRGKAVRILAASAALPGLLPPVELEDGFHVDGGVTDLIPVDRALEMNPAQVWVLDVAGAAGASHGHHHSAMDVLAAGFAISLRHQAPALLAHANDPRIRTISLDDEREHLRVSLRDFTHADELIEAGRRAAKRAMGLSPLLAG